MGTGRPILPILTLALALTAGCANNGPSADAPEDQAGSSRPDLSMDRLHLQIYGETGLEWEMTAPSAQGHTSESYMIAEDVHLTLFESGEKSTDLSAQTGILMTESSDPASVKSSVKEVDGKLLNKGDMFLRGDVVAVSTDGARLETDWLWYHRAQDIITSTAPVRVTRGNSVTTGSGLEATSDLGRVQIFDQTVIFREDEADENAP